MQKMAGRTAACDRQTCLLGWSGRGRTVRGASFTSLRATRMKIAVLGTGMVGPIWTRLYGAQGVAAFQFKVVR
jgi:hypothetical protein